MKTLWSVIKMILLTFVLILVELGCIGLLGFLYVKVAELIENTLLRYLFAILWFAGVAAVAKAIGKFGLSFILDRD